MGETKTWSLPTVILLYFCIVSLDRAYNKLSSVQIGNFACGSLYLTSRDVSVIFARESVYLYSIKPIALLFFNVLQKSLPTWCIHMLSHTEMYNKDNYISYIARFVFYFRVAKTKRLNSEFPLENIYFMKYKYSLLSKNWALKDF